MKKIAFCFLIYDTINHEELWNFFFENVDKNKYQIYIHYKNDVPLKYFNKYKLENCVETKYADVSLLNAMNTLLKNAYDDGCDKFIFLSHACIPLKSFTYVYDFLTKDDHAYFNVSDYAEIFPRASSLIKYYNIEHIRKSHQWCILNKKICEAVLQQDYADIEKQYKDVYAPEEYFYITTAYKYQLTKEIIATLNIADGATTFTFWAGKAYKFNYPPHCGLKNYMYISEEELLYLVQSKSLFARKFSPECDIHLYNMKYLQSIRSSAQ